MLLVGTRRRDAMRIDNLFSRFPQGMGGERAGSWVRGGSRHVHVEQRRGRVASTVHKGRSSAKLRPRGLAAAAGAEPWSQVSHGNSLCGDRGMEQLVELALTGSEQVQESPCAFV